MKYFSRRVCHFDHNMRQGIIVYTLCHYYQSATFTLPFHYFCVSSTSVIICIFSISVILGDFSVNNDKYVVKECAYYILAISVKYALLQDRCTIMWKSKGFYIQFPLFSHLLKAFFIKFFCLQKHCIRLQAAVVTTKIIERERTCIGSANMKPLLRIFSMKHKFNQH